MYLLIRGEKEIVGLLTYLVSISQPALPWLFTWKWLAVRPFPWPWSWRCRRGRSRCRVGAEPCPSPCKQRNRTWHAWRQIFLGFSQASPKSLICVYIILWTGISILYFSELMLITWLFWMKRWRVCPCARKAALSCEYSTSPEKRKC